MFGWKYIHTKKLREPVKNYLADFFPLRGGGYPPIPLWAFGQNDFPSRGGGGYPPIPLRVFGQNDFPLRGGEYPPIPLRKKSAKNSSFWPPPFPLWVFWQNDFQPRVGGFPLSGKKYAK